MKIHFIISSNCYLSYIIPDAFICEMMILAATCKDTREALEREGMPIMVRVSLRRTCFTRDLYDELRWACIRFPSVHKQNVSRLALNVEKFTRIQTLVRLELDLQSIELEAFSAFETLMLKMCKALEHKSLVLRCRVGCYHCEQGFTRCWYDIDESGLLDLLQRCMCEHSIDILLRYENQSLYPADVLKVLGLQNLV